MAVGRSKKNLFGPLKKLLLGGQSPPRPPQKAGGASPPRRPHESWVTLPLGGQTPPSENQRPKAVRRPSRKPKSPTLIMRGAVNLSL